MDLSNNGEKSIVEGVIAGSAGRAEAFEGAQA